ncbi:MAG: (2Fe-2S)-binding protein [Lewinellaceae bacterium]|nr:(2Fe-2S)-binding protein [Saprospiraceae bacterium]MCB9345411.1 (2Fe-2S)-binding protein [Lewinellaceae bacterium]
MPKVTIDGKSIEVEEGTTILNAARQIGGELVPPAMCYYSTLKGSGGKCRTCLVKVTKGSDRDPRPMPKLMASCQTMVMDGMEVASATDESVTNARAAVTEFLLINHPLDCPICDQAGECHLQDLAFEHGKSNTRFEFERRTFEKIDIGPYIKLHMTRCIMCWRCVYTAQQLTPERVHGIIGRGDHAEISTYIEKSVESEFSGNVIDVCPVGALTDRTFRFKSRVWFLNPMDAHRDCPTCSGKAVVWMYGGDIYRVTARKDKYGEVHDFICNTCRFEKKDKNDWIVEGPRAIDQHSVISQNHYDQGSITVV